MFIEWNWNLSVGVRYFDDINREMVEALDQLYIALKKGALRNSTGHLMTAMIEEISFQFEEEERAMADSRYPFQDSHMKEHEELLWQLTAYQELFHVNEFTLTCETLDFIALWLKNHIEKSGRALGRYLNEHQYNPSPFIKWEERNTTGISQVDELNRKLVDIVNILYNGIKYKKEVMNDVIVELLRHVKCAFGFEESMMIKTGYAHMARHRHEHQDFFNHILRISQTYKPGNITQAFDLMEFLMNWINFHVAESDRMLGLHLKISVPAQQFSPMLQAAQ